MYPDGPGRYPALYSMPWFCFRPMLCSGIGDDISLYAGLRHRIDPLLRTGEWLIALRGFGDTHVGMTSFGTALWMWRGEGTAERLADGTRALPDDTLVWLSALIGHLAGGSSSSDPPDRRLIIHICRFAQRSWIQRVGPAAARAFEDQQKLGAAVARAERAERLAEDRLREIQTVRKERGDALATAAQLREELADMRIDLGEERDEAAALKKRLRDARVAEATIERLRAELEERGKQLEAQTRALATAQQTIELLHVAEQHTSAAAVSATAAAIAAGPAPPPA